MRVENTLVRFDSRKVTFDTSLFNGTNRFEEEYENFMELIRMKEGKGYQASSGSSVRVSFDVAHVDVPFAVDVDQGYNLRITKDTKDDVTAHITAETAFGVRYALVTLSQLMVFDEFRREMLVSGCDCSWPSGD